MTYRFQATQYGSTWYHAHIIMQYGDGLQGSLIINGPATANYDHDLGMIHLTDWNHAQTTQQLWGTLHTVGGAPPSMDTGLINGTNTFDCTSVNDPNCVGGGKKFEATFVPGDKHRIRLVNGAVDGHFEFSIDGHQLQVIANDLVPIKPYFTDKVIISMGQRYDIIVEANQTAQDYWLRGGWNTCSANKNAANITGIIRYNSTSTADPTTSPVALTNSCVDEPRASLIPHLSMDVAPVDSSTVTLEDITLPAKVWLLNGNTLNLTWDNPTTLRVFNGEQIFPADYNVVAINVSLYLFRHIW
jgi:FtsP/CotA-like multicopper oxidase with cupredoxin domain